MRTIHFAESKYRTTYPGAGYACLLSVLGGDPQSSVPNAQAAHLIDPTLASTGNRNGYYFRVTCDAKTATSNHADVSYEIDGMPVADGKTGFRGFCLNESGVLKYDSNGGDNCTQPVQSLATKP
jgi:type IV pilus assembly protein PilA